MKKKMVSIMMVVVILVGAIFAQDSVDVQAASKKARKKAALSAYARILNQKKYQNQKKEGVNYHFSICDLNGDHIPEMILSSEPIIWGIIGYYSYVNGKVVKIKPCSYPVWGTLYEIPSRKSFALFRGGPAIDDVMPYTIWEYKIIKRKIKWRHTISMDEYMDGKTEYFFDEKPCGAKKYKKIANSMKEIKSVPNTAKNRKKYGVNQ